MDNEELLEYENGVNSIDEEEEVKVGEKQTDHIQNKRPKEVKRKRPKPNPREDQSRLTKLNLPKACARTASCGGS